MISHLVTVSFGVESVNGTWRQGKCECHLFSGHLVQRQLPGITGHPLRSASAFKDLVSFAKLFDPPLHLSYLAVPRPDALWMLRSVLAAFPLILNLYKKSP